MWGSPPADTSQSSSNSAPLIRESSAVPELLSVLYALRTFGPQICGRRVQVELDSDSMYFAARRWFSDQPHILDILNDIYEAAFLFRILIRFEFIPREYNHIADSLSMGTLAQAQKQCREHFNLELRVVPCSRGLPQSL